MQRWLSGSTKRMPCTSPRVPHCPQHLRVHQAPGQHLRHPNSAHGGGAPADAKTRQMQGLRNPSACSAADYRPATAPSPAGSGSHSQATVKSSGSQCSKSTVVDGPTAAQAAGRRPLATPKHLWLLGGNIISSNVVRHRAISVR